MSLDTKRRELNRLVRKYEQKTGINQDMSWARIRDEPQSFINKQLSLYRRHPDNEDKPEKRKQLWDKYYRRTSSRMSSRRSRKTSHRSRKSSHRRYTKNSMARLSKDRQGPPVSAKAFPNGTNKRGNDGKMWVIIRTGSTQRWKRK